LPHPQTRPSSFHSLNTFDQGSSLTAEEDETRIRRRVTAAMTQWHPYRRRTKPTTFRRFVVVLLLNEDAWATFPTSRRLIKQEWRELQLLMRPNVLTARGAVTQTVTPSTND